MTDKLLLTDGIEAEKSTFMEDLYLTRIMIGGYSVEVDLVAYKENSDTKEALKYAFEKYYRDAEKYNASAMDSLCSIIKDNSNLKVSVEDLRRDFVVKGVAIIDLNRVGMLAPPNVHVELNFMNKKDKISDDVALMLSVAGTLEEGFDEFFVNGLAMSDGITFPLHELSTGDVVKYSQLAEVYSGSVEMLNDVVECYFELDDDGSGAESSFALFEKVFTHIYELDQAARGLIFSNMLSHIDDVRKTLNDDDLTLDEMKEEIFFESAVFGSHGEIEFSYVLLGDEKDLKATAMGTYNMGFTGYMVEYLDREE